MNAELCMLIAGTGSFLLTLHWVRSRELREKYAVYWMLVASVLFLAGLFPPRHHDDCRCVATELPRAVLFIALAVIYGFAFSVSASLTRQHRASRKLLQEVALLEERLRRLESSREPRARPAPSETEQQAIDTCTEG